MGLLSFLLYSFGNILNPILSEVRTKKGCISKSICLNQFYLRDVMRMSTQAPMFGEPRWYFSNLTSEYFRFLLGKITRKKNA